MRWDRWTQTLLGKRLWGAKSPDDTESHTPILEGGEDYDDAEAQQKEPKEEIFVHPKTLMRRWIVLLTFIFLSVMNNFTQFSFSSIVNVTKEYYVIEDMEVNLLAVVFMISGFTTRFVAMWIIDNKGLGVGIFISAILNCIGGWIRYWPGSGSQEYKWLLAGQCVCAVSQSFIDIAGPKIAANWFPPNQRTTATALAQGPIFVAVLLAYAVTPHVVDTSNMDTYLLVQSVLMMLATILIFAFFRGSPSIPPSYSAAVGKMPFWEAVKSLLRKKDFIIMFFVFSITLGTAMSLSVLMDQIVGPAGYSNSDAGILVTVWISGAIVGGCLGGPIVDRTHAYKPFMIGCLLLVLLAVTWFTLTLQFASQNLAYLCVIISIVGLGAAGIPAILEATVETIYPVPEATAMGVLFLGLNVTAIVFTLGMENLRNPKTGSMVVSLYCVIGLCTLACILVLFFKGDYKRLEYEKKAQEETDEREDQKEDKHHEDEAWIGTL